MTSSPVSRRAARAVGTLLLAASLSVTVTGSAPASSMLGMDLEMLSASADRILVGKVEKTESRFLSQTRKYIVTDVTVVSERQLLGASASSRVVIRQLGGTVGKLGQRVFGEASYRVGERVLVFAVKRQGVFYTLGMQQGVLHIHADERGVARIRSVPLKAELLGPASVVSEQGRKLEDVISRVRSLVARRARR
ncbi:MAG TPA: hypothetical protein VI072_27240 [Polyangiaceae bacterium]